MEAQPSDYDYDAWIRHDVEWFQWNKFCMIDIVDLHLYVTKCGYNSILCEFTKLHKKEVIGLCHLS
jgi:hypothetical protein